MTTPPIRRRRVALSARPRMLADAITQLLTDAGAEVVPVDPTGRREGAVLDAVIVIDVTDCAGVDAEVYAVLDTSAGSTGGAELRARGGRSLGTVDTSDQLISVLLRGPGPGVGAVPGQR